MKDGSVKLLTVEQVKAQMAARRNANRREPFFQTHPVFTHEEYAQSRGSTSPRTVDSLLRKHAASGRIARVRRGLYTSVPSGAAPEAVDPFLVATKAAPDAAVSHHAALQFHGRTYSMWSQGLFLAQHRERLFVEDAHLERLASHAPNQPRYLDSTRKPGRLVHPWNLIVPEQVLRQSWEEVA